MPTVIKDPDAVLPYSINWASEDGTNDGTAADTGWLQGDTIVTSTWTITGPDSTLTKGAGSDDGKTTTVVLSGGTRNRSYTLTNHIITAAGYQDDRSITVKVMHK